MCIKKNAEMIIHLQHKSRIQLESLGDRIERLEVKYYLSVEKFCEQKKRQQAIQLILYTLIIPDWHAN